MHTDYMYRKTWQTYGINSNKYLHGFLLRAIKECNNRVEPIHAILHELCQEYKSAKPI